MSLYKRADTDYWWCRFQVAGREHRQSTRTRDRRAAQVEERRLRALAEAGAPDRRARGGAVDVAQLAEWDAARALAEGADATRAKTLEWLWTPLARHFAAHALQSIDHDAILGYVTHRRSDGVRGQTIRREVQALRRGLTMAVRKRLLLTVPTAPKIRSDAPLDAARGLLHPPAVIARWIAELPQDARDEVELALRTGLRAAELKRARFDWVEPAPDGAATRYILRVPAHAAKTRRARVVGLTDAAAAIIQRRADEAHTRPEGEDRETILSADTHRTAYRAAAKRIWYSKRIKLRDLRHTFATLAVAGSGDPWAALESLGHRDLRTTSLYQHTTEQRAAATAAAAEKLLGVGTAESAQEEKVGRRRGFRTHDPRLVRRMKEAHEHLSACIYCQQVVLEHAAMQPDAGACRHSEPAHPLPASRGR